MQRTSRLALATALATTIALLAAGCAASGPTVEQSTDHTITVVAHDSYTIGKKLLADFKSKTGITVKLVQSGDATEMVSKLILSKDDPLGDVVLGVSNDDASRLIDNSMLLGYTSPLAGDGAQDFAITNSDALTAVDHGEVCMNVDTAYFSRHGITPPKSFEDIAKPEYKNLAVVSNPAASSPGLSFLIATVGHFGQSARTGWQAYWKALKANGVKIAANWEDTYNVDFSFSGGDRPIALSYASSPAYTVNKAGTATSTAALLGTCYQQVEYAGILTRSAHVNDSKKFIDFLLSSAMQRTIPGTMYMYPVNADTPLPAEWKFAPSPTVEQVISVPSSEVVANRQKWIKQWQAIFS